MTEPNVPLVDLLQTIAACTICNDLPLGPNPVLRAASEARILVIGQAPGTRVHNTGIPWNDPSGVRLRQWMGLTDEEFYNPAKVAIMPMGFCYPGKGKSGDLPPRVECAPQWHERVLAHLPSIRITLLIGKYAQEHYLGKSRLTLTERVHHWRDYQPDYFPLVHPSPRNQIWLKRNAWFEQEVIPELQEKVKKLLAD